MEKAKLKSFLKVTSDLELQIVVIREYSGTKSHGCD